MLAIQVCAAETFIIIFFKSCNITICVIQTSELNLVPSKHLYYEFNSCELIILDYGSCREYVIHVQTFFIATVVLNYQTWEFWFHFGFRSSILFRSSVRGKRRTLKLSIAYDYVKLLLWWNK